jgi:hypothetical protein
VWRVEALLSARPARRGACGRPRPRRRWVYARCVLTRAFSSLVGVAVIASRIACVIVIAWFVVFAVDQSKSASTHQQNEVPGGVHQTASPPRHRSTATKTLDEAGHFLTTPFRPLASKSSNVWLSHGIDLLLVLLVYGLAVGFVARVIRVRV